MKKTTILSIVVLLIVSVSSISYSVLLHKENRALIAKQDSLYTLSEAQMVFKENGLRLVADITVSIQDVKDYAAKYSINLPESKNSFNINGLNPLIVYYLNYNTIDVHSSPFIAGNTVIKKISKEKVIDMTFITMQQLSKGDYSGLFSTLRLQAMRVGDLPQSKFEIKEIPIE